MLKIKDDVDLKELEKFGFEKKEVKQRATYQMKYVGYEIKAPVGGDFIFVEKDRTILFLTNYHTVVEDTLFDLIQAGLVEKVKEE